MSYRVGRSRFILEIPELLFLPKKPSTRFGRTIGKHYDENIGNTTGTIILTEIKSLNDQGSSRHRLSIDKIDLISRATKAFPSHGIYGLRILHKRHAGIFRGYSSCIFGR
jgi:hypothetical protein